MNEVLMYKSYNRLQKSLKRSMIKSEDELLFITNIQLKYIYVCISRKIKMNRNSY